MNSPHMQLKVRHHLVKKITLRLSFFLAITLPALLMAQKPNVLFIVCDDLNTHVSSSDYPHIKTPTFDRFEKQAMNFQRAYCQYPVCGPSRASFLSGLYPQSTGVLDNKVDIKDVRPGTINMPGYFKSQGYWTGGVGKIFHGKFNPGESEWHEFHEFKNDELPIAAQARLAFEKKHGEIKGKVRRKWMETLNGLATQTRKGQEHVGYGPTGLTDEQHKDGKNAAQVAKWFREKSFGDKPFFMAVGIHKPHAPFLAPQKYFDMYPKNQLIFQPGNIRFWSQAPKLAMTKRFKAFGFELNKENDDLRRDYMQAYHACITFLDAQIGKVLDALETSGEAKNTIVVLTSDHGYLLGEKFMWGKVFLFENCTNVPMLIRVPGMTDTTDSADTNSRQRQSQSMVQLLDLFPTLIDLCELPVTEKLKSQLQGESLVPILKDPDSSVREYAYTVVSRSKSLGKTICNERYRYTRWPQGEELYDLKKSDEINLIQSPEHRETLTRFRAALKRIDQQASKLAPQK